MPIYNLILQSHFMVHYETFQVALVVKLLLSKTFLRVLNSLKMNFSELKYVNYSQTLCEYNS